MYRKIYENGSNVLIAACDRELLGIKIKQGKAVVEISKEFYEGEIVSEAELIKNLENATTANLFGARTVNCALKCGLITADSVLFIEDIPHAQIFKV
ncbi:MAG: DUF424 family protein [Methanosarcinaceae archaeon]|nr:DUF424 family protein [Methanosarcinaceae archaeon]MDD4330767.1 DUF424 family protein [Methanosarcinaceae archaeon]MDD4748538.1 DUF424 family protein [Methanosarcinaceae archaeon]